MASPLGPAPASASPWLPSLSWSTVGAALALVSVGLIVLFIRHTRRSWEEDFAHRLERSDPQSPSNKKLVKPEEQRLAFLKMQEAAGHLRRNSVQAMVGMLQESGVGKEAKTAAACWRRASALKMLDSEGSKGLDSSHGERLDMDHVRITYLDYVWGLLTVGTCATCLWISGISKLLVRQRLESWGWARPAPCDAERVVGLLLMEGIGPLLHCNGLREQDGRKVANFSWLDMPLLDNDGKYYQAKLFTVDVDIETKRMVKAKMDADEVSATDAMILIWFDTITASHVKLHAYGNWATNVYGDIPKYVRKVNLVTVLYNYFGFSIFPALCDTWYSWGWSRHNWKEIRSVLRQGVFHENIKEHSVLKTLMPYSEVTDFVVKLRNYFLNLFAQHRESFLGIDGEAFFVGTVLHSLEHTVSTWNLEDPLWLDIHSKRFGLMAEIGRFVRVGFVEDLPFLPMWLNKRYKTAPGKFFKSVYDQARRINPKLADYMDTCIVK